MMKLRPALLALAMAAPISLLAMADSPRAPTSTAAQALATRSQTAVLGGAHR